MTKAKKDTITEVVYTGTSDAQEFAPYDFKKAGIEDVEETLHFRQGQPTEVNQLVAEALTAEDGVFGDFPFRMATEEDSVPDPEGPEVNLPDGGNIPDTSGAGASTEGTANPSAAGNVGKGSTGAGTSTRGTSA